MATSDYNGLIDKMCKMIVKGAKLPGDFITKVKQSNKLVRFNFDVDFCRSVLPYNLILCLHHFDLRSLQVFVISKISVKLNQVPYVGNLTSNRPGHTDLEDPI